MTADIQAAEERLITSRDRARETAKRGDIFDPNPQLAAMAIEATRYADCIDTVLDALADAKEAGSILQQAVLERTAERDDARRQAQENAEFTGMMRDQLTAAQNDLDDARLQIAEQREALKLAQEAIHDEDDEGPCAICSDPDDDGPCPEHRPAPATAALAKDLLNRWLKASNSFFDGAKLRMTAHPVHDDTVEFLAALSSSQQGEG